MNLLLNLKKKCLSIKYSIKYNFSFLKVLNSPFKGLMLKWYFGPIKYGTPYFLPRKLVKCTKQDCEELLEKDLQRSIPKRMEGVTWEHYKNYRKSVPIKYFGINYTPLGWKTKYEDYRYEWSPSLSIVIFNKQLFFWVIPKKSIKDSLIKECYWEAWLYYNYRTNPKLSKLKRLEEVIKSYSCSWSNNKESINYYKYILRKKYLKHFDIT